MERLKVNMINGQRLKQLRKERNITAQSLADDLQIGVCAVFRYEANKTDASSTMLSKFADYFNVTTDYLLGRTDKRKKI